MQATPNLIAVAIDAALSSHGLRDYFRGIGDSRRYSSLCQMGDNWFADPINGAERIIVSPISSDYLDGLRAGGCTVNDRRSGMKRAAA